MGNTNPYRVDPPMVPPDDRSGDLGQRLLALLRIQVQRNLVCLERDRRERGIEDPSVIVTDIPYCGHFLGGSICAFAVLARFGGDEGEGDLSTEKLEQTAVSIIHAWTEAYEAGQREAVWGDFASGRFLYLLGLGAWLLWHRLDEGLRASVARILEVETDRFLAGPAPAQLYDDTQAESNAWHGAGIAAVSCMLKYHPHRALWDEKAKEYLISAYATVEDVASDRVVDGKPLREWLTGPNAFPDHTVENHGFVHPDYMAAVSEMIRGAVAYTLAGEPIPEAVTFSAAEVFDRTMAMSLPDGTHLYVQGTDYTPRRVDSLFQVCNLVTLQPNPQRKACFLRSLATMEEMARKRPDAPMSAWIGVPYDLGTTWGLTQNYLMSRFYGDGGEALLDASYESSLAGVHLSEDGCFVMHRTPETISTFSWHARTKEPKAMGLTMPLDRDVLCYPMPWSSIGNVREALPDEVIDAADLAVVRHDVQVAQDGFSVTIELTWCSGKVRQDCAFVSLPDGRTVYLERRAAVEDVTIACGTCGDITVCDDTQWVFQDGPRAYFGAPGRLDPEQEGPHCGNWLNIDNRMGCIAMGADQFLLARCKGRPCIWRGDGTMYDICRIGFLPDVFEREELSFGSGEQISNFAMVSCPNQTSQETAALASALQENGISIGPDGLFVIELPQFTVWANLSGAPQTLEARTGSVELPPFRSGWLDNG